MWLDALIVVAAVFVAVAGVRLLFGEDPVTAVAVVAALVAGLLVLVERAWQRLRQ